MWQHDKQHWRLWYDFTEFQKAAQELANAIGYRISARPWDGGWVIFNLRNLFGLAAEREADAAAESEQNQSYCEDYDEDCEALMELQDDFARSAEDGWFYGD